MRNFITSILFLFITVTFLQAQGLEVNTGTDVTNNDEKNGYAIIGDETGSNIVLDNNEIQTKTTNLPGGTLFINDRSGNVSMAGSATAGNVTIGGYGGINKLTVQADGGGGIGIVGDNVGVLGLRIDNGAGYHNLYDDPVDNNTLVLKSIGEMSFLNNTSNEAIRIKSDGDLYIGQNIVGGNNTQVRIYSDDNFIVSEHLNNFSTSASTNSILAINSGAGSGNRVGVEGVANGTSTGSLMIGVRGIGNTATASNAYGVYGEVIGNSSGINRYGVYGTAPTNSGESWGVYANGDLYYTGSVTAPSDARLKTAVKRLSNNTLEKVMQLEVKNYEYRTAEFPHINLSEGMKIGFIAQELQQVFPELVHQQRHHFKVAANTVGEEATYVEEKLLGVDYVSLVPILTKAIQEQQAQIEALKLEVEALKNK